MSLPEKVVNILLENDEEDPKDFVERNGDEMLNHWEQIGGDYGDPWVYGGDWYNPFSENIVHIYGAESYNLKDEYYWDIELTPEEIAGFMAKFPVDKDPEDPNSKDDNQCERENAMDELKIQKSEAKVAAQRQPVYRFLADEVRESEWAQERGLAIQGLMRGELDWESLTNEQKWLEIGRHTGFDELDSYPEKWTKAELSAHLGLKL